MTQAKELIFKLEFVGLGDNLFYSALPRLQKEQGLADKDHLSDQSNFYNPQLFDLVWKSNPYLDGLSDKAPTPLPEIAQSKKVR